MPKRILYIHGISEIGGAEQDLLRLLERIDRHLFEPVVVCPPNGPLIKKLEQLNTSLHPMDLPSWRKFKDVFQIPMSIWSIFKLIRNLQIALVHVNDYWWGPISCMASQMARVPCIVHIRQEIETCRVKQYRFKKPDKMIAVSHRIKDIAIEGGVDPDRITVIYSGIDVSMTANPSEGKRIREQYNLSYNQPVIGTVANLFPRKGYEYLIEALCEVRKKIPNIHCLIVGEGDHRYHKMLLEMVYDKRLQSNITFTGFQLDVLAHIAAMDIFVLPSLMEGFGIALLEAMAMEKPVVATGVGGIPEIVEDPITGFLVPSRNSDALAQKIFYLFENPTIREQQGVKGRNRVVERFSINRTVTQLETLYGELAI